jgi:methylthioribose-1-phosphate isomerase
LEWLGDRIRILDQTRLPTEEFYFETADYLEIAAAIKELKVRGAPAIGVAAAFGIALGALSISKETEQTCRSELNMVIEVIRKTRPTARNLFWAVERMTRIASINNNFNQLQKLLVKEALNIHREAVESSLDVSRNGAVLINDGATILTHCNTGPLATVGYGTALGIIICAFQQGKKIKVLVDETRPLLQGSRLTTWELQKAGIPFTLITDSMAGYFMSRNEVDLLLVGADCITANGDTANKIGTYSIAVLARAHRIPFYVAAPTSTINHSLKSGREINIEERRPDEITKIHGISIAPDNIEVSNPAFDVTPAKYITAIITERGIINKPFKNNIEAVHTVS